MMTAKEAFEKTLPIYEDYKKKEAIRLDQNVETYKKEIDVAILQAMADHQFYAEKDFPIMFPRERVEQIANHYKQWGYVVSILPTSKVRHTRKLIIKWDFRVVSEKRVIDGKETTVQVVKKVWYKRTLDYFSGKSW